MGLGRVGFAVAGPLLGAIVPLALSLLVVRFSRRRDLVAPFVALNVALAGWNLDVLGLWVADDLEAIGVVDRVGQIFIDSIPWCWIHFTAAFLGRPLERGARRLLACWCALLMGLAWTPWYFTGYRRFGFGYYGQAGPLYPLVVLTFAGAFLATTVMLLRGIKGAQDPRQRNQRLYALTASFFLGGLGFDAFLPLYGIDHYPLGNVAVVVYGAIMTLALVNHRLMDFTVVFRRGLLYSVATVVVCFACLATTLAAGEFLRRGAHPPEPLPVALCLGVAVGVYPFIRWVDGMLHRALGGRSGDRRHVLRLAADRWRAIEDEFHLLGAFTETMTSAFPCVGVRILEGRDCPPWGATLSPGEDLVPVPGEGPGTWCIPLRVGDGEPAVILLTGGKGWRVEDLDFATDLAGLFSSVRKELAHRVTVRGMERLHTRVLDSLDMGVLLFKGHDEIVASNHAARRLLGELGLSAESPGLSRLASEKPLEGKNGREIRVRVSGLPAEHLDDLRVAVLEDVTREMELARKAKRLETLSALGRMGAMVAHEVRTPLSTILGACRLLRTHVGSSQEATDYMEVIMQEVKRVDGFVDTCLRATRNPRPVLTVRDFDALVGSIAAEIGEQHPGKPVTVDLASGGATVAVDEGMMRAVVANLVENARQSYEGGWGSVEVATSRDFDAGMALALLTVSDHGRGIDDSHVKEMFEPFWTRRPGGVGIGLTVVANAVAAMNGSIVVRSATGKGTSVTVSFPTGDCR